MRQSIAKELKKIAADLPPVYIKKQVTKIEYKQGMKYIIRTEETQKVKHLDRLKYVYELQGRIGILRYINHTHNTHRGQKPFIAIWEKQLNPGRLEKFKRWILAGLFRAYKAFTNSRKRLREKTTTNIN